MEAQIQSVEKQILDLPKGSLSCTSNGTHYKWFHHQNNNTVYLPKKQKPFAEQLAQKKYLCALLKDLIQEQHALKLYLNCHNHHSHATQIMEHPEFGKLLSSWFSPSSQEMQDWVNSDYERNPQYPDNLIHKSISGNIVRSKSEAMIDMILYTHKLPYRYECALTLGDVTLYPDFTLRHPLTGATLYWEHFGQMDNPAYTQSTYSKLQLYTSHGIIPSIHLITTYETKANPLTADVIEKTIAFYFEN